MALDFSAYDRRNYPIVEVREGYRRWAPTYDGQLQSRDLDIALLERLGTVAWAAPRVVDLACGTGRIGAWLAECGAGAIHGVDLTPEMLAQAEQRAVYADTRCEDIRRTSLPNACADLVANVLSVEHLPELAPFYAEAARLLDSRGTLVVVGYHPHFLLNGIPTHFRDEAGDNVAIENYIHLFSDHVRAAREQGFALGELAERVVGEDWIQRQPSWSRHVGRPVSFALVWNRES